MNSSVKFFDPIVTVFPLLAGSELIVLPDAVVWLAPALLLDDLVSFELPQAENTSAATITARVLTRFMRFPSSCLRAEELWVSLLFATGRSPHQPRRQQMPRRLRRQAFQ